MPKIMINRQAVDALLIVSPKMHQAEIEPLGEMYEITIDDVAHDRLMAIHDNLKMRGHQHRLSEVIIELAKLYVNQGRAA